MNAVIFPFVALTLLALPCEEAAYASGAIQDTAVINRQTRDAYSGARRTPDISIILAHQALSAARQNGYRKGMADASLALGMAYLAKYNPRDSAWYYNNQALTLYEETGEDPWLSTEP